MVCGGCGYENPVDLARCPRCHRSEQTIAERGLLPAEPTVVVGQPTAIDPSRAPEGRAILWIQLQELPWQVKGDAAGELDVGDGTWTDDLRERYADRIQARIAKHRSRPARTPAVGIPFNG